MKRHAWLTLAVMGLAAAAASAADDKGTVVEVDGLKSTAPAAWKKEEAANAMRAYQFVVPKADGDKEDATLVISYFGPGGGGGVPANLERWKGQFEPPAGKTIADVFKVEKLKVGAVPATYVDVQGTHLFKARPFDPNAQVEKKADYRMIAVVFESPKGPYFFRLVGPAKTVAANKAKFDEWLKNFQ